MRKFKLKWMLCCCVAFCGLMGCAAETPKTGIVLKSESEQIQPQSAQKIKTGKKIGIYKLAEVQDPELRPMCEALVKNLNEFSDEGFMLCDLKISPKYPELKNLDWKEVDVEKSKDLIKELALKYTYPANQSGYEAFVQRLESNKYTIESAVVTNLLRNRQNMILKMQPRQCDSFGNAKLYVLDENGVKADIDAGNFQKSGGGGVFQYNNQYINIYSGLLNSKIDLNADAHLQIMPLLHYTRLDYSNLISRTNYCNITWTKVK